MLPTDCDQSLAAHRRAVLLYVLTCCRDLALAEDIVQETMLIAQRKRDQYFAEADFTCWLCAIARNVWFRERRKRVRDEQKQRVLEEHLALSIDAEEFSEERFQRERAALAICLEKLPEIDRQVISAHFAEERKYHEIADQLQRTVSWVKMRMLRARTLLAECLRQTLATDEA
jgi:RNA polymerase sigma-70 factor (ECF subfamily)